MFYTTVSMKSVEELNGTELMQLIKLATELLHTKFPDLDLEPPKKARKTKKDTIQPSIPTSNRFAELSQSDSPNDSVESTVSHEPMDDENEDFPPISQAGPSHTRTFTFKKLSQNKSTGSSQNTPVKMPRISPIFLKDKSKWNNTQRILNEHRIQTTKCKLVSTGIQIDPSTEEDYRKLIKILDNNNLEFYTYQLRSEKLLKVVLRGVMQESTEQEIREDLLHQGYPVSKIIRMKGRDGLPAPMILVEIAREYKSIYNLSSCCGLAVSTESLRSRSGIIQCHKCQSFGHSQLNCHIKYKCMKCGEEHSTHLCTKPITTPPKCANCSGEHLSTFLRCPSNPNNPNSLKLVEAPLPKVNPWYKKKDVQTDKTNEILEIKTKPSVSQGSKSDELALILGRMIITLNSTNATVEQKINFINQTNELTVLFSHKTTSK